MLRSFFIGSVAFSKHSMRCFSSQEPVEKILQNIQVEAQDFSELFEPQRNFLFLDKTELIKDIIHGARCLWIYRPRGWGKSMTLSMIRYFFSPLPQHREFMRTHGKKLKISQLAKGNYVKKFASKHPVIHFYFVRLRLIL